jgi:Raf kinase inhibitor-like YbhB/YbcL family protein
MGIAHEAVKKVASAIAGARAGDEKLAARKINAGPVRRIEVTSPAFTHQGPLPIEATVDGNGTPPLIAWTDVPAETRSIVLLCEDPDAPFPEPFVHWIVYGISAAARLVDAQAAERYRLGKNSKLAAEFTPAAPPPGHGPHRYHFQVFALDGAIEDEPGLGRGALLGRMKGHVLAWGEIIGVYERR